MFVGHYGVAFAAKRLAPRASLGVLVLAAEFLDALGSIFLLAGVEHVRIAPGITRISPLDFYDYPLSHALVMTLLWAAAFSGAYHAFRRYKKGAWVAGAAVLSHWFLDALVHRPDMPLWPHGPLVGLGLWNSLAASIAADGGLFAIGVVLYATGTQARDAVGRYGLWSFVVLLFAIWVNSLRGLPPPNVKALEFAAVSVWLMVLWMWWVDRHRELHPRAVAAAA